MGTQKWENKFIVFGQNRRDIEAAEEYANLMGDVGWELVAVTSLPDPSVIDEEAVIYTDVEMNHHVQYSFKRPIEEGAPLPPPRYPRGS